MKEKKEAKKMMRKNKILCIAIILLIAVSLMACGKDKYRMVKIESYDGNIALNRDGDVEVFEGINLIPDDRVETGDESGAMLLVDDDKHLVAGANTQFTVNASGTEENGLVTIDIVYGQALIKIDNSLADGSEFEVNTPNATLSVRGTTFGVSYDMEIGETKLLVYEGKVRVDNGDSTEVIEAGNGAVVTEDGIDKKEGIVTVIDKDDDMPSMEEFENDISEFGTTDISDANIGDIVYYGTRDYGNGDGVVPVAWDVLDKEDGRVLLISHCILGKYQYNDMKYDGNDDDTNWEQSRIRSYLNSELINEMFTAEEQTRISEVTITNPSSDEFYASYYPSWEYFGNTNLCGNTSDKLFLLSWEELIKYYGPLEYNEEVGQYCAYSASCTSPGDLAQFWWLRSSGRSGLSAMTLFIDGAVNDNTVGSIIGVRPAMWVTY